MDFEKEWLLHFAKNIPKSFFKKRVVGEGNFLWHIFSWNKVDADKYFAGDKARKIFDELDKTGAKYFYLWETNPSLKRLEK